MTSPSEQEEQWFKEQELKKKADAEAAAAHQAEIAEREAGRFKCPKCGHPLAERVYENIKIDECTSCHGAWLDPGELEQLTHEHRGGLFGFLTRTR